MTAYGDSNTAIEAMELGAFDYLVKPIDFNQVRAQLARALQHIGTRARRQLRGNFARVCITS